MLFQAHLYDIGIPVHLQLSKNFFLSKPLIFRGWASHIPMIIAGLNWIEALA